MKALRIFTILLLLFLGISATYGGFLLMKDPTGNALQLPFEYVKNTPFDNYLIPGIVLFFTLGISGLKIAVLTMLRWRYYLNLILLQGIIVLGWIVFQILMIRVIFWLQFVIATVGLLLVIASLILKKEQTESEIR